MRICSAPGCKTKRHSHGFCRLHARRFLKYGDPTGGPTMKGERLSFLKKAVDADSNECIEWPYSRCGHGYADGGGYGVITIDGRQMGAHRLACIWAHGDPPVGEYAAAHRCGNSACVNPKHLYWATAQENSDDKKTHNTTIDGERHGLARLTNVEAESVRALWRNGAKQADLARQFKLSPMTVSRLVRGETYRR